ncbi:SDR family NAD(P)-dependent oxidoreductase [Alteromonas macleodii]|uniref:SDR family NAD(P)-dependent oxidoreductase n=1 Tax=Alteromonas macleodii TaxID=28108 RepID=UPI00066B2A54|nr:SDR family oxidoreductase [Alteromonas macleodii]CAI3935161.1 NAD(P)-dependent dehydrogenase [Alteromonas macleodii]VTP50701.1 NAD(P)-dependent dehydrogenase [Alteromonas macleodii]
MNSESAKKNLKHSSDDAQSPVCIVTGGSLGIGFAVCKLFSQNGYQVINLDIRDFEQVLPNVIWKPCDVSVVRDIEAAVNEIISSYQRIDALVCNAGIHVSATIEDTDEALLDKVLNLNVKGAYGAIKSCLPTMKEQGSGAIVVMGSDQSFVGKRNSFAYGVSKGALASMAKTTALDYAPYNIRVNAVCPGTIETPLFHNAIDNYVARSGADKNEVVAEEAAAQPIGRLGQPEDVAELTYFLCSNKAAFITGSLYAVDGGYTAQ